MADRYWVGGTDSWNTTAGTKWATFSGGPGGASVPTAADNVFFDQTGPYTVSTGGNIFCLDLTVSVPSITFSGAGSLTISGSLFLAIGTPTFNPSASGITFNSTVTGRTITTNGTTIGNPSVVLNGVGGSWTLGSSYICNNNFTVTNGTFNTANFGMVIGGSFNSSNSNTRTITLGSSQISIFNAWNIATTTGLTFSGASSTITLDGNNNFFGGGLTYGTVNVTNTSLISTTITGANTFSTLSFAARAGTGIGTLSLGANQTVTTSFSVQSGATDPKRRLFIVSNTLGTARTITSASNTIFGADFRDITGAGAASWSDSSRTNYWGDCKGNSGITFSAGQTVYCVSGSLASWGTDIWSDTSGGTANIIYFPLAQDTATINNVAPSTSLSITASFNIGTVDMSNRTNAVTLNTTTNNIYGNWINGSGTTLGGTNALTFSGRNTQSITSAGKSFTQPITIASPSGTVSLVDDFAQTNVSGNVITLTNGTFDAVTFNVTTRSFLSSNSNVRTLNMGSGLWSITGISDVWTITATNLTFNSGTANIILTDTSTSGRTFVGGTLAYNKLTIGGATGTSTLTITSAGAGFPSFTEIASTKTVAHTITLNAGGFSVANWTVTGTAGNVVTINSLSAGVQRPITYTGSGVVSMDYMSIRDIDFSYTLGASNPYLVYAGANSTNGGNNSGILFQPTTVKAYRLTTGTSFTTPADWNNSSNTIHLIGAGGGGGAAAVSGNNRAAGGGGGGGGYTVLNNQTLSGAIPYTIGTSAANANGGSTTFNTTNIAGGGLVGTATTVPLSTGGAGGTGVTFNGGSGGAGSFGTAASTGYGSGGGGGAGGPNGVGGNGGTGFGTTSNATFAGGGGGGNGGGSAGGNASSGVGGNGGNNFSGTGGGTGGNAGTLGGGGSGRANAAGAVGGSGIDIDNTIGGAGGVGGSGLANSASNSGLYGGGGSGGIVNTAGSAGTAGAGSQGVIFIVYTPGGAPVSNSNFFFFLGSFS
jgi:hypothetical protein